MRRRRSSCSSRSSPSPDGRAGSSPAGRSDPRRGRRSLEAVLDAHLDKVYAVARELDELGGPDGGPRGRPAAIVPAGRARPLQPVRGDRRQPELRAGAARRRRRRLGPVEPACALRDAGLRQGDQGGSRRTPGCPTRRRRRSGRRWPDRLGDTAAGDGPDMAPTTSSSAATDTVTRPRARAPARAVAARPAAGLARARPGHGLRRSSPAPPSPGLEALLGGLNPDQLRAVTHGDGPLLVVAGAGTGKTQVITRRIAWLIATRRAKPSEILALTFTDKAAEEMAVRVDQLVPYGYTDTAISHVPRVRRRAHPRVRPRARPADRRARPVATGGRHLPARAPLRVRPRRLPAARRPDPVPGGARDAVQPVQGRGHLAGRLPGPRRSGGGRGGAGSRESPPRRRTTARGRRRRRRRGRGGRAGRPSWPAPTRPTRTLLAANGCIDFGDQVALALRLVRDVAGGTARRSPAASGTSSSTSSRTRTGRRRSSSRPSPSAHRNVTVVGDDDQAIYAFRGAAVDNILDFQDRYLGARTVVLRRNYRSLAPILDAAYRLIRFNDPDRLEVRTGDRQAPSAAARDRVDPAPVRLEVFASGSEEADWIAAEIGRRIEAGAAPRDHAVLVRANGHADPILRALNMAGIPWRFSGTSGLYARPEVRLLLAVPAGRRGPRVERGPVRPRGVRRLRARRRGPDRHRQHGPPAQPLGLGGPRRARPAARDPARRARHARDGRATPRRGPARLRRRRPTSARRASCSTGSCAGAGCWPGSSARTRRPPRRRSRNIARFFEIVRSQSALLADDRAIFVARHLATLIEAGDDPATAELDPDADAVAVLTVHKAKGLEFPVVFLPGMVAGRFPSGGRGRPAGAAGRPRSRRRRRRAEAALGRGTPAVLRRDDPGARRARPVARGRLRRGPGAARLAVRARGARPAGGRRRPGRGRADAARRPERLATFEPDRAGRDGRPTGRSRSRCR